MEIIETITKKRQGNIKKHNLGYLEVDYVSVLQLPQKSAILNRMFRSQAFSQNWTLNFLYTDVTDDIIL